MKILLMVIAIVISTAAANAQVVPILDLKAGGLLGGVLNGKFVDAKTAFKNLGKDQKYNLYDLEGNYENNLPITIELVGENDPCAGFHLVSRDIDFNSGIAVGTNASWNILPRAVKEISLTDKTYLNIVSNVLKSKGLPRSKAVIEEAFRVDLEGDGVDEVILTASSYGGSIGASAKAGDYSFVLLRKVVAGKAVNIMLGGDFVKKKIEFGAPSRFEVSAIADLNGDKQMEIIMFSQYYEGSGAWVTQIKNGKEVEIKELEASCGV